MPSKNFFRMKTITGAASCGRIMPQYVSTSPSDCIWWNSGTISACGGTMIPASTSANSQFLPGKSSREKP